MRSFSLVNFGPRREAESVLDTAPNTQYPQRKAKPGFLSIRQSDRSIQILIKFSPRQNYVSQQVKNVLKKQKIRIFSLGLCPHHPRPPNLHSKETFRRVEHTLTPQKDKFSNQPARFARAGTLLTTYIRTFFNFESNLTFFRSKKYFRTFNKTTLGPSPSLKLSLPPCSTPSLSFSKLVPPSFLTQYPFHSKLHFVELLRTEGHEVKISFYGDEPNHQVCSCANEDPSFLLNSYLIK